MQEPWIASGNEVSGIKSFRFHTYFPNAQNKVRTAILVSKNMNSYFISNLSTDDLTVVTIECGRDEPTLLASCYMPHDTEAPLQEPQRLVILAGERKQPFVKGTDANAQHTLWGSSDCNDRGESLIYFLLTNGLYVANQGDVPAYVDLTSENVLDLTRYNHFCSVVKDWRVLVLGPQIHIFSYGL